MSREKAIEATKRALQREFGGFLAQDPYNPERFWTMTATAVIDAAAPHLVGEPIGYSLVWGGWVSPVRDRRVEDVAAYRERTGMHGAIVALVPVEDTP